MEWQPYRLGSARRVGLIGTLGRVLSGSPCPACQGKGVISVKEPIERCDACRGRGRVSGTQLLRMKCKGAGVATVGPDGSRE